MKLTDNEIRDIIHLLEQGRPLPDSYRFMLFEDKRETKTIFSKISEDLFYKLSKDKNNLSVWISRPMEDTISETLECFFMQ